MFGFGKDNTAIDAFALEVCADLAKRFPPGQAAKLGGDKAKIGLKLGNAYTDIQRKVAVFQQERKLGVYGKARMLNAIREELTRRKYSEAFVSATTDLLVHTPKA